MPHLKLDRVTLAYQETGTGEPIVFLHEFAGSMEDWNDQVESLARAYRVITYNCRGYPPSSVPSDPAEYSQELAVEDLRGVIDGLSIEKATLIGLSMGGSTVLNFAARYPERVKGMVLASTGSGSDDKPAFRAQFSQIADLIERDGSAHFAETFLRGPTRLQLLRKRPLTWQRLHRKLSAMPAQALANTIRGVILERPTVYELETKLRGLQVSKLILVGDEDTPVLKSSDFLARALTRAHLISFPRTGHTLNLEEPARFKKVVREFLGRLP
jgi:pimeloyl-ACP methyl ester carboxylesterase